jgi:hypothetical protein
LLPCLSGQQLAHFTFKSGRLAMDFHFKFMRRCSSEPKYE